MEHFYIYILLSKKDNKLYIGFTNNLRRHLQEHNQGKEKATKNRRPFKLIRYEYFINQKDAKAREIFLKSGYGHQQLNKILKNTLQ